LKSTVARTNEEEVLKILSEEAPVGVCIVQDGKFCYFNSNFPIAIGYTVDELIGKDSLEIVVPEDREMVRENTIKMLKGKLTSPYQFRVIHKDGSIRWVMAAVRSVQYHGRRSVLGNYMEITERERAERRIQESERRYRLLAENAEDVIWTVDIACPTRLTYISPSVTRLLGYSVEETMAKEMEVIFTPASFNSAMKAFVEEMAREQKEHAAQHRSRRLELQLRHKNGSLVDVEVNYSFIRGADGQKDEILAVARDITERKRAEEALGQSEERYRTILEEMEDAYSEVDLGGHLTFVNSSVCRYLGYSREELIGMSYKNFTLKDDIESVFRTFNKVYRTGVPNKGFSWKIMRKDGSHGFAETSVSLLRNDKGEIIGFRSVGRDITERKQADEAFQAEKNKLQSLIAAMEDGLTIQDRDYNIIYQNEPLKEIFGDQLGEKCYRVYEGREKVCEGCPAEKAFKDGKSHTAERKVTLPSGEVTFWENTANPIRDAGGRIVSCLEVTRNITERKRAEEALRQSEEKYRTILEEMEDSYFEVDLGGHLTFVNSATCHNIGYSSEELIGMSYKGFTLEDDIESVFRTFNEVYLTGKPNKSFPWTIVRKDGSHRLVEHSALPLRNDKGEIIGFRGVGRDITERKQAEEKLRQSEENYKTLFNSSVVGMYVMDAETMKVVMGNKAAREMIGFSSAEEGIGVNPFDFVVPEDRDKVLEIAINELLQDSRQTHEIRVMDKDGRRGWQSISIARIMHKGRLASLVSFTDITERKRMEEALRQSEENYRALFDSSVIGTIVIDAETMKVVMANQAAAKTFGLGSAEEGIGVNPLDFIPPEDRDMVLDIIAKDMFERDLRQTNELHVVTKDGREIWISATGARIIHEGKLAGLISFTDITEQKRQNERLMMTDRLASLGELAAGAAHELNNPLTSIVGFSQLLMEKEVPGDIREDLKLISNEAQRAVSVTNNLLTFARKHAPMKQLNRINNIIEDVLELRAYEQEVNHIDVERHLATNLPEIMVDYFQMQQVFMNIIINAEYFMTEAHNRGTLTIATRKQNSTVRISITDDGPGITPENLKHIFDPFFTTKEAGKGTGLGLSICHGVVTEHGGQIYVRSQLGKGVTTFIELPIKSLTHIKSIL